MEIVIKINNSDYEYIKNGSIVPIKIDTHIYDAIRKGTPLPKGHGRLIDAESLYDDFESMDYDFEDAIEYAPTVIPADKEG